jgi:hypothetical protein
LITSRLAIAKIAGGDIVRSTPSDTTSTHGGSLVLLNPRPAKSRHTVATAHRKDGFRNMANLDKNR